MKNVNRLITVTHFDEHQCNLLIVKTKGTDVKYHPGTLVHRSNETSNNNCLFVYSVQEFYVSSYVSN